VFYLKNCEFPLVKITSTSTGNLARLPHSRVLWSIFSSSLRTAISARH